MRALTELQPDQLKHVKAVLTDIDDTLTLDGKLPAVAYQALEDLDRAGLAVIPVTGRPAGWCDMIARFWPVKAVVGENGAFSFTYDRKARKMRRIYAQEQDERRTNVKKLHDIAKDVLRRFPGTALASDQAYREVDIAVDFCEDVEPLTVASAQQIAAAFASHGAIAKVSSIHVNAWFGQHDKLAMSLRVLKDHLNLAAEACAQGVVYCGDSPNDAPMFAYFPLSVGMANITPLAHLVSHLPAYVTKADGGHGFVEVAELLLQSRSA